MTPSEIILPCESDAAPRELVAARSLATRRQPQCRYTPSRLASRRFAAHRLVLVGLLALTVLPGCTVCLNAKRTILGEPSEFSWQTDRKRSIEVYRHWADQAWGGPSSSGPSSHVADAYEVGFKDGFVDYVYAGGSGEPPPVAPREFWNVGQRNPQGHASASDWFAGYRHGAQVARDEGYRERALAPAYALLLGPCDTCEENSLPLPQQPLDQQWQHADPLPTGPQQPEQGFDAAEPNLNLPPDNRLPQDNGATTEVPALEELPMPTPDLDEAPIEPKPSAEPTLEETAPELPSTPSDIEQLFGPPTAARPQRSKTSSVTLDRQASAEDRKGQAARAAFASAIRRRGNSKVSVAAKSMETMPHDQQSTSTQHSRANSTYIPLSENNVTTVSAISAQQPTTIPRSHDQSEQMFRRLSQ